jgi:hypothetical protein
MMGIDMQMNKMPNRKTSKEELEYQACSDCRTLLDAEKIEADKPRFKRAVAYAKQQLADLQAIAGEESDEEKKGIKE